MNMHGLSVNHGWYGPPGIIPLNTQGFIITGGGGGEGCWECRLGRIQRGWWGKTSPLCCFSIISFSQKDNRKFCRLTISDYCFGESFKPKLL